MTINTKRKYRTHIANATGKAVKIMAAISRAMMNVGGPSVKSRRLYYLIMESVILYSSPMWGDYAENGKNAIPLRRAQKIGLVRVTCAYRTAAGDGLSVLSGCPRLKWIIKERGEIY